MAMQPKGLQFESGQSFNTRLSGRRLFAARLAWAAITILTLALFMDGIPAEYAAQYQTGLLKFKPALDQLRLSTGFFAAYRTALDVIEAMLFALTGIFIFWRKSDDFMVMLVSITNITFGALFVPTLVRLMEAYPALSLPVAFVRAVGLFSSLVVFYYLFPDGQFVPSWLRWAAVVWGIFSLAWFLFPSLPFNLIYLETWFNSLTYSFLLFLVWYGSGAYAQIFRYRRVSTAVQRQQTKWVVYGTTVAFLGFLLYNLTLVLLPQTDAGVPRLLHILFGVPVYHLFVLAAPVCIGLSILRFRLWDIDFIINRSLVYSLVSGLLVGLYFGGVLLLSLLFRAITGGQPTQALSVLTTLGIAAVFTPLRNRVQTMIDRRFYRRKYDAVKAMAAFGITVRDEVDLYRLSGQLLEVIRTTLQPNGVSLWLNPPSIPRILGEDMEDRFEVKNLGIQWSDLKNHTSG